MTARFWLLARQSSLTDMDYLVVGRFSPLSVFPHTVLELYGDDGLAGAETPK